MWENLEGAQRRYEDVTRRLSDPAVTSDREQFRALSKEHADLRPLMECYEEYRKMAREIEGQEQIAADAAEDPELRALAGQELPALRARREELSAKLKLLLLPKDPLDNSNIVLEIRAGTGGEEAALFAADLYRMYTRFAEGQGWRT